MDDRNLIRRYCENGDPRAAAQLFERYEDGLYNFIWQMLRHQQDAEDATQEAIRKALAALPRYEPRFAFKTWLYRIGRNEAINVIRKRKRLVVHESPEELADADESLTDSGDPQAKLDALERRDALRAAIAQLPDVEREVLILRFQDEVPFKEIAKITAAPLGTVLARMHNAKKRLKRILQPAVE